jgi:DNA-binding LacI/PurR family transcriptional regulator
MAVTIKDIAREAGVSHSTVSRALRDHPAIASHTTERIKRVANELGYVPSALARGLKTNRSNTLGVIVSRMDEPDWGEALQGIEDHVRTRGYNLFVSASNGDTAWEISTVMAMSEQRVDGIIVCDRMLSSEAAAQLRRTGVPIVVVDDPSLESLEHSVSHDHRAGGEALARHLMELGHQRIGYLGHANAGWANQSRMDGVRSSLAAHGIKLGQEYVFQANEGTAFSGEKYGRNLVQMPQPPTAMICFNDAMAIGLMHALRQAGWDLPAHCSVVGYDNIGVSAYSVPPLSTFEQPRYELGAGAAQLMLELVDSDESEPNKQPSRWLSGTLITRSSTAQVAVS